VLADRRREAGGQQEPKHFGLRVALNRAVHPGR
jgi:hypothetical protein